MAKRLFIPGTGGCIYSRRANGAFGEQVGSILEMALGSQNALHCEHDDDPDVLEPRRTSGLADGSGPIDIGASGHISAVYRPFEESLTPRYTFYDYDWRLDIRYSAGKLREFLSASGDQWDVVCHSQGGLILLVASLSISPDDFHRLVRRVVFLGVPFGGNVNAATALLEGVDLLPGVVVDKRVVRTWPSVYMMLPRWHVGVAGVEGSELLKPKTWERAGLLSTDPTEGLHPQLLLRAQEMLLMLAQETFEALKRIERFVVIQGRNHNTRASIPAFPALPVLDQLDDHSVVRGDGLVPADLTMKMYPGGLKDRMDSIFTNVRSHMLMGSELQKFQLCESFFA